MSARALHLLVDGGSMHLEVRGQGEPVLLVHGIFASSYCWRLVAEQLAKRYTVYSLDLLGFGMSDMPPDIDYSQSAQARRVLQVVDQLGLSSVRLVGHSMGGEIAAMAACFDATPFSQLVLVAADGFRPAFKPWQRRVLSGAWMGWVVRRTFDEKGFRRFVRRIVTDPTVYGAEEIAHYVAPYRRAEFPLAMRRLAKDREAGIRPEMCSTIQVPTLLLWGEEDRIVPPRIGEQYRELLPNVVHYLTCPNCGHMPMEEYPEWLTRQLVSFFAGDLAETVRADHSW
ncbi:alpha/beta fold hydrolase [Tumebacillus lipolyticus]|uniref:Alpha/beta fold hydrolase n=1 Tax=Tumebacillus lipolyticus TaxID=1280370 RepID=A0ABW5A1J2_9BACL